MIAAACAAFLACIAQQGFNPDYIHRLEVQPDTRAAQILYDGVMNEETIDALRFCAGPVEPPLVCEYHAGGEK